MEKKLRIETVFNWFRRKETTENYCIFNNDVNFTYLLHCITLIGIIGTEVSIFGHWHSQFIERIVFECFVVHYSFVRSLSDSGKCFCCFIFQWIENKKDDNDKFIHLRLFSLYLIISHLICSSEQLIYSRWWMYF